MEAKSVVAVAAPSWEMDEEMVVVVALVAVTFASCERPVTAKAVVVALVATRFVEKR